MKYYRFLIAGFGSAVILSAILFGNLFAKSNSNQSRLDGYNKIRTVISNIENYYVDDISMNDIVNKAISGLLTNLDAHSLRIYHQRNIKIYASKQADILTA